MPIHTPHHRARPERQLAGAQHAASKLGNQLGEGVGRHAGDPTAGCAGRTELTGPELT
jgi:hypothetical protein